eukprot:scaffold33105_cov63-Phaeocystis_antarctica.AAC.4
MVRDAWCVMRAAGAGGPEGQLTGLVRGENDAMRERCEDAFILLIEFGRPAQAITGLLQCWYDTLAFWACRVESCTAG